MRKQFVRCSRRVLCLTVVAALLCLGLAGCRQPKRELTVRSAWGLGSMTFDLPGARLKANEAGTRVDFQSRLSMDEIAEIIAEQLPENTVLERPGGSILLRQTNGTGENTQTDYYYLTVNSMMSKRTSINETEKAEPRGKHYLLTCLEAEFASPDGNSVKMLFPRHLLATGEERVADKALPTDTPMRYGEIAYRELLNFYDSFGRYNIKMVDGVMVINGYKNLPADVDELQLPPMGQRVYLKVDGLAREFTIQVSFKPGPLEPDGQNATS